MKNILEEFNKNGYAIVKVFDKNTINKYKNATEEFHKLREFH